MFRLGAHAPRLLYHIYLYNTSIDTDAASCYYKDIEKQPGGYMKLTATKNNIRVTIEQDELSGNPYAEWDQLSTIYHVHPKYDLGTCFGDAEALEAALPDQRVLFPLYKYDHSGITLSTEPFSCPWDSGQVGYIFVSKETIEREYGEFSQETIDKAKRCIKAELDTFNDYLAGNVWGYTIESIEQCGECGHERAIEIDSCGGFYGGYIKSGILDHINAFTSDDRPDKNTIFTENDFS